MVSVNHNLRFEGLTRGYGNEGEGELYYTEDLNSHPWLTNNSRIWRERFERELIKAVGLIADPKEASNVLKGILELTTRVIEEKLPQEAFTKQAEAITDKIDFKRLIPKSPGDLYALLGVLVAAISVVVTALMSGGGDVKNIQNNYYLGTRPLIDSVYRHKADSIKLERINDTITNKWKPTMKPGSYSKKLK